MNQPVLVVMAAGMGSRFGGLKQITPVDTQGHKIIDFSLYDARRAGFTKVVFVIKHAIEEDFKARVGRRMEQFFDVRYVFQELDKLPPGYDVPAGREKPWGTAHAIACAKDAVDGPFAVINSDDYYGPHAYQVIYDFLSNQPSPQEQAMVGYLLKNTVTENGHVARGICQIEGGYLTNIVERTHIERRPEGIVYTEDGQIYHPLADDTIVSMNLWGFSREMMDQFTGRFPAFLEENLSINPLKCEYFLPAVANLQVQEKLGRIRVLTTDESWYGVTYREDLQSVWDAVEQMKEQGIYPAQLWT